MSSRSYRLKAKEGAAGGVRRIALGRADKAMDELNAAREGEPAEAIHGARKDLKKLRAVLRLVRDELGDDLYRAENRRYRDAGRLLSESRDAEAKLEALAALQGRFGAELPRDALNRWRQALEAERDEATNDHSSAAGRIDQAAVAIAAGRDHIPLWPLETDTWALVGPGLLTSYRRGRRAMKRALADPSPDNVHAWRKRAKDLWYQLRIVREAWPALLGVTAEEAHELADRLGDHHDLVVLGDDLASREQIGERHAVGLLLARRQGELLGQALEIGRRLYVEKPKAFDRRLKRYWLAWRES
jgi:CHAD domain-containing protein